MDVVYTTTWQNYCGMQIPCKWRSREIQSKTSGHCFELFICGMVTLKLRG